MQQDYSPEAYWNQFVSGQLDLVTVDHDALGAYNRVAYQFRLAAFKESLAGIPRWPHQRVFEAAFGVGFYLKFHADSGVMQLSGVDLSQSAAIHAKELFPQSHLFQHDITTALPIPSGSFDLVTAIDVLYHIVDDQKWEQALAGLCAFVAPGGALIFTDKCPVNQPYQTFAHVRRRPLEWYAAVFQRHGLAISSIRPVFDFMDDPIPNEQYRWLAPVSWAQWRLVIKAIRTFGHWPRVRDGVALILAGVQAPFEKLTLGRLRRSPNLELVVAQRSNQETG